MAAVEDEEVVRRLRQMQEGDPSLTGAEHLCYTLRLLSSHIESMPASVLVNVWPTIKDETLKQIHLYKRKIEPGNSMAEPDKATIGLLIQTIDLLLCQCLDLPCDMFWEECAWAFIQLSVHEETELAMDNMYRARELLQGLLRLIVAYCSGESPFSNPRFEEASVAKFYILLRLSLELKEADGEFLAITRLFPKWDPCKNTRVGLQIILKVVQKEAAYSLDVTQHAEHLLKEFRLANEEEWTGCLASLLHQILQTYLEKGPMFVQQKPTRALLRLFSSQSFAQAFLDCITFNPDPHRSSASGKAFTCSFSLTRTEESISLCVDTNSLQTAALASAFQIFELVYAEHCETIVSCCLAKAVDEQSDLVLLRLQCLNSKFRFPATLCMLVRPGITSKLKQVPTHLYCYVQVVGKIQAHKWNFSEDPNALCRLWAEKDIRNLFKTLLQDSSIRVRRSAMQIFLNLSATNILNQKEMLKVCLMKTRDQDEKVRFMAFQILRKIPMKTLMENLAEDDWNAMCKRGFSEENKEIRALVEVLLLEYITTGLVAEPPSERLQILKLVGAEGGWSEQHFSFVYDNVETIWKRELDYLTAVMIS